MINPSSPDDDAQPRMSDIALRKKKNADAQAAFRARRANYIASLEETVTSLEGVVLQLQDSCKEAKAEAAELRAENARLRREGQEREKMWRHLWMSKRAGGTRDELPPLPIAFFPAQANGATPQIPPLSPSHYPDDGLRYTEYATNTYATGHAYATSAGYTTPEHGHVSSSAARAASLAKYGPYSSTSSYALAGSARGDAAAWTGPVVHSASSGGESCPPDSGSSSHSPAYVESPTLMSPALSYMSQYATVEDQKMPIASLDAAPYVFSANGHSPTLSAPSTPTSTSSTGVTSPYHQMGYTDSSVGHQERSEYAYRRQGNPDMTLHGGIADISSLAGPSRYAMPQPRRQDSGPSSMADYTTASDPPAPAAAEPESKPRSRKDTGSSQGGDGDSRSPTPSDPPISGTLAVIKAQAFGALRRNRARTKRSSGAAKVAIEALEARGIGMGIVGVKRQRRDSDDEDGRGR